MGQLLGSASALVLILFLSTRWFSQVPLRTSEDDGAGDRPRQDGFLLAANVSACHPSFTDANRPVNCCPARKDADQKVINFELSMFAQSRRRIRRPAHLLDGEFIAKYQRAVAIMKSLPKDHPHSFFHQANNHCLYCTGSYDQVNSSALFKIHRSWLFFPWHRAFLFFHERILGKLLGDETFALPYWNWDNPDGMVIPGIFTEGALNDGQRDRAHQPPDVADLNFDGLDKGRKPEERVAENLAFMYHQMVSGARKPELFLGCKLTAGLEGFCDGPGTLEGAPHNTLHRWVGSGLNPERENMGAFYSAAHDPIFYGHHSNIDRLWEVWRKLRGEQIPDFTESAWLDSSFTFYDENLRFVRIKVRDCLDITKMGYAYEKIGSPWLNARPKPAVPPEIARGLLKKRDSAAAGLLMPRIVTEESSSLGSKEQVLHSTVTLQLQRARRNRSEAEKEEEEEVLVVYGIRMKHDTYAKFDVFINLIADEETAGPLAREFAGSFVNTPEGARRVGDDGNIPKEKITTLKLGVSELLEDLQADGDDTIWVSLVPRGGTGGNISVDGVRIEFLK